VGRAGALVRGDHNSVFNCHFASLGLEAGRSAPSSCVGRVALARGNV